MSFYVLRFLNESGYVGYWRVGSEEVIMISGSERTRKTYWNKYPDRVPPAYRFCTIERVFRMDAERNLVKHPAEVYLCNANGEEYERQAVGSITELMTYLQANFPVGEELEAKVKARTDALDPAKPMEERVDICVDGVSISRFVSSITSNLHAVKLKSRDNPDLQAVVMQCVSRKVRDALTTML